LPRGKPRVALVQTQAEQAGAQEISRILGRGLEAHGYEVHHVFFFRRTCAFDRQPNTHFCATGRPAGPLALLRMLSSLVRHLRQIEPDAVLCFQHYGNIIGALAACLAGARIIVANRNSAKQQMAWWVRSTELGLGLAGLHAAIVVNCKTVESEYAGLPHRYRSRVVRIEHGFEPKATTLARPDARKLLQLPADATVLGSVGRLHPFKNLDAAVALLAHESDWHLALAGQGPAREQLTGLAASLDVLDRVHFMGELPPERIGIFLRALDVFLFPSLAETFGLAAVEAAQAGTPVVANQLDVLHEVLAVDGEPCALFVDPANTGELAAAVRALLKDDGLAATLASRGTRLSQRYSLDAMVLRYEALIEKLLHASAPGMYPQGRLRRAPQGLH
jgi:glycosyltransferase involved in cell wall biosynthesis